MSSPNASLRIEPGEPLDPSLKKLILRGSRLEQAEGAWRLLNDPTPPRTYTNAQLDDYEGLPRRDFRWRPPLRLTVRTRFSHGADQLRGTAGFGFWNDPFMMTEARAPALPRTAWFFFASPPSDMPLAEGVPGHGWKAATLDAIRPPAFLLAPTAPLAIPLMNIPALRRRLWPVGQRAIGVSEALVEAAMTDWHTYALEWELRRAVFSVDERVILDCATPPRGPLGLVMWIDNQAMVAKPWGRFGWQTLPLEQAQWMEIGGMEIVQGDHTR